MGTHGERRNPAGSARWGSSVCGDGGARVRTGRHHTDNQAIESALSRALRLWFARPREFRHLAAGCMQADYSWRRPGQDYLAIYGHLRRR
jgi:hypothetical protein